MKPAPGGEASVRPGRSRARGGLAWGFLCTCVLSQGAFGENGDVLIISRLLEAAGPTDLTFAPPRAGVEGSLWASTRLDGRIYRLNLGLDEVLAVIDNPHGLAPFPNVVLTWGIAYRAASDSLFVLAQKGPEWLVKEVRTDGTEVEESAFVIEPPDPGTSIPRGLAYDTESGELWYLDTNNDLVVRTDFTGRPTVTLHLPGDDPPQTVIRGEGLAYVEDDTAPDRVERWLYLAYGDLFRLTPSRVLQLTPDGVETGVHVPLTAVPGASFYGFEVYRTAGQRRLAQVIGDGRIAVIDHTIPAPVPPAQLTCRLTSSNLVALSWQNHGGGEAGSYGGEIVVVRNGSPVTSLPGNATSFLDTSPSEGTSTYALQAAALPGGALSPASFPCKVTVGPGGLVRWVPFAGKTPYDIGRDPRQGDLYVTDPGEGRIYRYSADLEVQDEIASPVENPASITFVPTIDIPTLALPGEAPSFTTLENVLAVGRKDSALVSLITLEGELRTTLSLQLSGGVLGGLTYRPETQEFAGVDLSERQFRVFNTNGRLLHACFPRNTFPPVPLSEDERLSFGLAYDVLQDAILSTHDDAAVREFFVETDTQGGCVATDFSFSLESLGAAAVRGEPRGIEIAENTLTICSSGALFQVLIHPFTVQFQRGDANRDGQIGLTDAVEIATYLFRPGDAALTCLDAADTNDDGFLDIADPVYLLFYLFRQGAAPPAPFEAAGSDPTFRDNLGCEA